MCCQPMVETCEFNDVDSKLTNKNGGISSDILDFFNESECKRFTGLAEIKVGLPETQFKPSYNTC